jgi:D-arabinose 1-dehydrogenase-like Zn-dependent alcohol dehydrogenase
MLLPDDIRAECLESILPHERPVQGDWIAIWGGSSTSALFLSEIARLAGLKVILVVDIAKHGTTLAGKSSILVDCHDPARAVKVIKGITGDNLLFAIDTVGRDMATYMAKCLTSSPEPRAHLVGLAALPKASAGNIVYHAVPIKLFHEVAEVGTALMRWLEIGLQNRMISLPSVSLVPNGLEGINSALEQMRQGKVLGRRLVVPI